MRPAGKPRVFLALCHRGKLSLPSNNDETGLSSFHWALLITPKGSAEDTHMVDVTDSMQIDPVRHIDTNPDRNWVFRDKVENPLSHIRLVLIAMIAKLRSRAEHLPQIVEILKRGCRVPRKDADGENCVWWVKEAISLLQARRLLSGFDVDTTFLAAQRQATDQIVSKSTATQRAEVTNFTSGACDVFFAL